MIRKPLVCGLIATSTLIGADVASAAPARLVRGVDATTPSAVQQTFMRDRFWRLRAPWAPQQSWAYQHAFGLDPADAAANPSWRLLDASGQPVYVGARVAADVGNAAFRAWWIARAQARLATGYSGLYVDDVVMDRRFTPSAGVSRTPIDPRTRLAMTEPNWQKQMADFMVAV